MSKAVVPDKPTQEAVAFYWLDNAGNFSAIKRPPTDHHLPNVWGLPSGTPGPGESDESTIRRSARDKLAVEVDVLHYDGEDTIDRGPYILRLKEYQVKLVSGTPTYPGTDPSITQYVDFKMAGDPHLLDEAAGKESLCSRIFLRNRGLLPQKGSK